MSFESQQRQRETEQRIDDLENRVGEMDRELTRLVIQVKRLEDGRPDVNAVGQRDQSAGRASRSQAPAEIDLPNSGRPPWLAPGERVPGGPDRPSEFASNPKMSGDPDVQRDR